MALEIRTLRDDEIDPFREATMETFGDDTEGDPTGPARFRALVPTTQAWAAFDSGTIVATAATLDTAIGVPGGGSLAMAGLTMVTVRPTHRRRGLMRALIQAHLDDARTRGLAISGLWASEAAIYGRFGYGVAAFHDAIEIADARALAVAAGRELDEVAWADDSRAREHEPVIYARATANRPGIVRRSEVWWRERRFVESRFHADGASRRRHVLARRGGEPVGYVTYRQRPSITDGTFDGKVEIIELVGIDPRAEATLWRFVCAIDLFPHVKWWAAPVDDTLTWIVDDPRRVSRKRLDNLWLRVNHPGVALAARRYPADGTLCFAIDDGTWELVVRDGRGQCAKTSRAAELQLGRAALGSLLLGGVSATELARAALVHGDAAAITMADRLFASVIAPWCAEVF